METRLKIADQKHKAEGLRAMIEHHKDLGLPTALAERELQKAEQALERLGED